MNLQGHHNPATPATPATHHKTPAHHGHHKPVAHHHVKRPAAPHHQKHHKPHPGHKSAPRGSLPVTEQVQAMLWHVAPAAC